jgi:purine-nucleoside phosphorylase
MYQAAIDEIRSRTPLRPRVAVVLGSGLGAFAEELTGRVGIPYAEIPGWPHSTAIGHAGMLVAGRLGGVEVAVMSGRVHLYEGYSPEQVVFGVRVLGKLGVKALVLTNAAGGINLSLSRGGLVVISDHINLQGSNPLAGPNDESLGPRFPDMSEAYPVRYREIAKKTASELGIPMSEGVYAAMLGPSYETPAEIRYLRAIGADLVGMSTVPEVIVAVHCGLRVLGLSIVTDLCLPDALAPVDVAQIIAVANAAEPKLRKIILGILAQEFGG